MAIASRQMTVEQLEREGAPEGRYELINGELVDMSPSAPLSGLIAGLFAMFLGQHVRAGNLGGVFVADAGFVLFPGQETVRVPDVCFVRGDRMPPASFQGFYRLAPDLVIEVVSPSDRLPEVAAKARLWLEAGSRLVWVVYPATRSVTVYEPGQEPFDVSADGELTGGDVLPEFRLAVSEVFPTD